MAFPAKHILLYDYFCFIVLNNKNDFFIGKAKFIVTKRVSEQHTLLKMGTQITVMTKRSIQRVLYTMQQTSGGHHNYSHVLVHLYIDGKKNPFQDILRFLLFALVSHWVNVTFQNIWNMQRHLNWYGKVQFTLVLGCFLML